MYLELERQLTISPQSHVDELYVLFDIAINKSLISFDSSVRILNLFTFLHSSNTKIKVFRVFGTRIVFARVFNSFFFFDMDI